MLINASQYGRQRKHFSEGRGFIGYPKGRNRDIKLVNKSCLRTRHINMFKSEDYSSFLNIFTKNLIYKFYVPISTFRVSYKATILLRKDFSAGES